jgi:hypothetical protein
MRTHELRRRLARIGRTVGAAALLAPFAACSIDQLLGEAKVPPGYVDPATTKTRDGARSAYYGALLRFRQAYAGRPNGGGVAGAVSTNAFVLASGVLSDELQPNLESSRLGDADFGYGNVLDHRTLPELLPGSTVPNNSEYSAVYVDLQSARGQAREAMGLLARYAPDMPVALRGHLHATIGYSEIFLADLFCSGVPLSTVDYDGNYTLAPSSTTAQVYEHAIVMFDSAMVEAADSARIVNMARVGKGRALLALGRYAEAAAAVASVPDDYRYTMQYHDDGTPIGPDRSAFFLRAGESWMVTVADREGVTGLDYVSSGDPRTAATSYRRNSGGQLLFYPRKYATVLTATSARASDDSAVVVADWVEARLIAAEAALQASDVTTWLSILNRLRSTAIAPALPDLVDPGTTDARVDLLFRERAAWLFLTGHRQGDMRRLLRSYGRRQDAVYGRGPYVAGPTVYGSDVNAPIPSGERVANPNFAGCIDRGA